MASTVIKSGLSTTATLRSAPLADSEFIVNGVNENQKFNNSEPTVTRDMGIHSTPTAPVLSEPIAGSVDAGVHDLYFVYKNSLVGTTSPIGTKASITSTGSKIIRCDGIPTCSDAQCDEVDIYMNTAGAGTGGVFYLAATVSNGTATTDINVTDAALVGLPQMSAEDKEDGGEVPIGKFIATKWNIVWLFAIIDRDSGDLFPSDYAYSLQDGDSHADYNEAEMFPNDNRGKVNEGDGDYITAVNSDFAHAIVIFKRNGIYFLTLGTVDDPRESSNQWPDVRHVPSDGVGCIAELAQNATIAVNILGDHRIFFPWYDGIWSINEQGRVENVSDEIVDTWMDTLNPSMRQRIELGYDPEHGHLLVGVSSEDATVHDVALRYDIRRKTWFVNDGVAPAVFAKIEESGGHEKVYFGDPYGFINEWWTGEYSGESTGTLEGTVAAGSTTTVVQVTGGGLKTSGGGLRGVPVWVDTPNGREYRFILSNTATAFTIDSGNGFGVLSAAPATGADFKIAYTSLRAKTGKHHHGVMDLKKLWFYVTIFTKLQDVGTLTVNWYIDGEFIDTYEVDMTDKEFHKLGLYATKDRANRGTYGELEFIQEGVNEPVRIIDIVFDAMPTHET